MGIGVLFDFLELGIAVVLEEGVEVDRFLLGVDVRGTEGLVFERPLIPAFPAVFIFVGSKKGVFGKPGLIEKGPVRGGLRGFGKGFFKIAVEPAEFLMLRLEIGEPGKLGEVLEALEVGISRIWKIGKRKIDWIEGAGGDRIVGTPIVAGIVERKELDDIEAYALHPIDEGNKIEEFSDA